MFRWYEAQPNTFSVVARLDEVSKKELREMIEQAVKPQEKQSIYDCPALTWLPLFLTTTAFMALVTLGCSWLGSEDCCEE